MSSDNIEAGRDIIMGDKVTRDKYVFNVTVATQRLTPAERTELDSAYLTEVIAKYEFWRTHYTPLAAMTRAHDERHAQGTPLQ